MKDFLKSRFLTMFKAVMNKYPDLTYKDIAERITKRGVTTTYPMLLNHLNPNRSVPNKFVRAFMDEFDINDNYYSSGLNPIFKSETKIDSSLNEPTSNFNANAKIVGNPDDLLGETRMEELSPGYYSMTVTLVPEYAYAGYLGGYADPEYIEELPTRTITVKMPPKGRYMSFEVVGDSMDDGSINSIPDGTIVTGRELNRDHWTSKLHLHRVKRWVIVHKTEGITVKEIVNHDLEYGIITCHSLNPDKETYPDFDVNLDDVLQLFNIVKRELN